MQQSRYWNKLYNTCYFAFHIPSLTDIPVMAIPMIKGSFCFDNIISYYYFFFMNNNYFRNLDYFMADLDKNDKIIEDEWLQIGRVIVGCTKLIDNITNINPKTYVKARLHHQTKSLVYATVYYSLPTIIKEKQKFRPYDVRKILLKEMQKIEDAYLTRILRSVNINRLTKLNDITDIKGKRGHPFKNNNNTTSVSGVKSFYKHSSY